MLVRALAIVACIVALSGCQADELPQSAASAAIVERSRVSMGSEVHLTAWTADEPAALAAFEAAFDEFDRLDALMSVWKPGSEIERLNAAAGEKPVPISRDTLDVLARHNLAGSRRRALLDHARATAELARRTIPAPADRRRLERLATRLRRRLAKPGGPGVTPAAGATFSATAAHPETA